MIPYGKHEITKEDLDSVIDALKSDFITQGPLVPKFEDMISRYVGAPYCTSTSNGTAALHISCLALGLEEGDLLWTSPISFVASANCGHYCGADVDFVDIDEKTWNISIDGLNKKLQKAKTDNRLPKILIAVHFCGLSSEMEEIHELSKEYGFKVIEDAAHALGGSFKNQKIGTCNYSDITIFSFHPVKNLTTGEGGMAVTKDESIHQSLKNLASHGIVKDKDMLPIDSMPWYYEQQSLGFNYRLCDFQAALGISQLERLDKYINKREDLARIYDENIDPEKYSFQEVPPYSSSGRHIYVLRTRNNNRDKLFNFLRENGVSPMLHYIPIYRQPFYKKKKYNLSDFPNSESYFREAITIPLYPSLENSQQAHVIELLNNY
ncbi:UDP-4-amino-4,6-dideoxy-N-acetyl-beta-L-altrosamine transaminase [Gammaproteobacteria bacterium]|nr:UDP-4-amino-4,6-dideoxy-N-acetyl-beta-L-altrosamine transaminase [Gammaproteobacteria bacterium]